MVKRINNKRTICEVLRLINDLCQSNTDKDKKIRSLLLEAHGMGKKMTRKLYEYNKEYDKGWWAENKGYEQALLKRLDENYLVGE